MTALKRYEKLESVGLWRPTPDAQRTEVLLTFGDATLVLRDKAERPLTHWSLAALERVNPGTRPAIYTPDGQGQETVEVEDDLMTDAIETVRRTIARSRPRPGRLRSTGLLASVGLVLAIGVFWLPGALRYQALQAIPASKQVAIGQSLLTQMQRLTGTPCGDSRGTASLARLRTRVLGPGSDAQVVIVPAGVADILPLPGGIVVMNRATVEDYEDPAVPAGYLVAAETQRMAADPMELLLRGVGLRATITLMTTGDVPTSALRAYAEDVVVTPPPVVSDADLIAHFAAAQVSSTPYALAIDVTGTARPNLISADPVARADQPSILSDGDWVALQGICGA